MTKASEAERFAAMERTTISLGNGIFKEPVHGHKSSLVPSPSLGDLPALDPFQLVLSTICLLEKRSLAPQSFNHFH